MLLALFCGVFPSSCVQQEEHTAPAVRPEDSVAVVISYGVNTLISDSGIIKYRIVAERWEVNQALNPSRWIFDKGLFMEQFDRKMRVEAFIQADTAYYYDQQKLWELRGRVRVLTDDGLRFRSEELFWDQYRREFYSHLFSRLVTPEREMEGTYFRSDENMNHYTVTNSVGSFVRNDGETEETDTMAADTMPPAVRTPQKPKARTAVSRQ